MESTETRRVGRATVLAGARSFKDQAIANVSDTYRGQVLLESGEVRPAVIKDIPLRELANEVMAAGLAYAMSLPVPPAFIAAASPAELKTRYAPTSGQSALVLASMDVSTPSFGQFVVGRDVPAIMAQLVPALRSGGNLGGYYGFDAWTANVDRHVGNILFDGHGASWLIDHGRCFTGPKWVPASLDPTAIYRHRFKEWLTPYLQSAVRTECLGAANAFVARLASLDVREIGVANAVPALLGAGDFDALVEFLTKRIQHSSRAAADALDIKLVA